jgi:hypothetical protein
LQWQQRATELQAEVGETSACLPVLWLEALLQHAHLFIYPSA